ncbi:MAG: TIGR02281 family clan AA aspartic protease [Rhizobiaceae bacterium]
MLQKVLLFSALVIGAAAYPLAFGPVDLSFISKDRPAPQSEEIPAATIARAETPSTRASVALQSDDRGHYVGEFKLNGRKTEAMVDTGATVIAINSSTARRIGLSLRNSDFTGKVGTANGMVAAAPVMLDSVEIGRIKIDNVQAVVIDDAALPSTLIGMSFLKQLRRFEVRSGQMVLDK